MFASPIDVLARLDAVQYLILSILIFVFGVAFSPSSYERQGMNSARAAPAAFSRASSNKVPSARITELVEANTVLLAQNKVLTRTVQTTSLTSASVRAQLESLRAAAKKESAAKRVVQAKMEAALIVQLELESIQLKNEKPSDTVNRLTSSIALLRAEKSSATTVHQLSLQTIKSLRSQQNRIRIQTNAYRNESERFRQEVGRLKRNAETALHNTITAVPCAPPLPLTEVTAFPVVANRYTSQGS